MSQLNSVYHSDGDERCILFCMRWVVWYCHNLETRPCASSPPHVHYGDSKNMVALPGRKFGKAAVVVIFGGMVVGYHDPTNVGISTIMFALQMACIQKGDHLSETHPLIHSSIHQPLATTHHAPQHHHHNDHLKERVPQFPQYPINIPLAQPSSSSSSSSSSSPPTEKGLHRLLLFSQPW